MSRVSAKRDRLLAGAALLLLVLTGMPLSARSGARKPNVVFIMMDDLGYGDIGSYGVSDIRTPGLDRLAREGGPAYELLHERLDLYAHPRGLHDRALSAAGGARHGDPGARPPDGPPGLGDFARAHAS